MYDVKQKCWISRDYSDAQLAQFASEELRDTPNALFSLAEHLLDDVSDGSRAAQAVYKMERAANMEHPEAALALGQMHQYGWAVHRSEKQARKWYQKAASLGNAEAAAYLRRLRRKRILRLLLCAVLLAVLAAGLVLLPKLLPKLLPNGVLVSDGTKLIRAATPEEFNQALATLVEENDSQLVISGQQHSNRLLLKFSGERLDLTAFPAHTVLVDEENVVIIQFLSEADAQACLEALQKSSDILFVVEDSYSSSDLTSNSTGAAAAPPYHSGATGFDYYSWGVQEMGLDELAAAVINRKGLTVKVAVLDTGVEPNSETKSRILTGADMTVSYGSALDDRDGHGTHTSGIILDCTRGLDVVILPVQVLNDNGKGATTAIVQGLRYAIAENADVINMSLGGLTDADSAAEHYFIQQAVAQNIVIVVSAGNGDEHNIPIDTADVSPACLEECIVVGAVRDDLTICSFSNFGDSVDVCAPGYQIVSYYLNGKTKALDGTSMAAPHVAALAAMLRFIYRDKSPQQIEKYIKDHCLALGSKLYYGEGLPCAGEFAEN